MSEDTPGVLTQIESGDAVLVHRRRTLRSCLDHGILSFLICMRIQRATRSPWNHIGIACGGTDLIEAEWGGVRQRPIADYVSNPDTFRVRIVKSPRLMDPRVAVTWATSQIGHGTYDWRWIIMLRVATLLFGAKGTRMLRARRDGFWICSELVAQSWREGGFTNYWRYQVPGDFSGIGLPGAFDVVTP